MTHLIGEKISQHHQHIVKVASFTSSDTVKVKVSLFTSLILLMFGY